MTRCWQIRAGTLLATAAIVLLIEDRNFFLERLLERLRFTRVRPVAEFLQRRVSKFKPKGSELTRDFESRNFGRLAEIAGTERFRSLSRKDKKIVIRSVEADAVLSADIPMAHSSPTGCGEPRVLFYLTNSLPYTLSGYTFRSQSTLKALKENGTSVCAVTRYGYPIIIGQFPKGLDEENDGIIYSRLIPPFYSSSPLQRASYSVDALVEKATEFQANILHTTTDFNNALIVAEAARRLGIPWVYEVRGELERTWLAKQEPKVVERPLESEFYRRARERETASMNAASLVIALSYVSKEQLVQRGVPPSKIAVIPNGVDETMVGKKFSRRAIRHELGLPSGTIVGTVTSVVGYEGLDDLIKSVLYGLNAAVLIVGDGVCLPNLKRLVNELGLTNRVIFAGRQDNDSIWKWYAAMDVFVVPRKNTLVCRTVTPLKPVLAQALGIPVVVSDLPALREVTGGFATFVPPEEPRQLAEGINAAISNTSLSRESVEWASTRTWKMNGRRISSLYNQLLKPN